MQALRDGMADIQVRYRIGKVVANCTSTSKLDLSLAEVEEVLAWIPEHPNHVLAAMKDRISTTNPSSTYLSLKLLEHAVNSGSYSFHVKVAADSDLRAKLVKLAADRSDNDTGRKVRSAARHIVLEFSRMFGDEAQLTALSSMAKDVEKVTGRTLLRSVMLEQRRIAWRLPEERDYCLIPPREGKLQEATVNCTKCAGLNRLGAPTCRYCGNQLPQQKHQDPQDASPQAGQAGSPPPTPEKEEQPRGNDAQLKEAEKPDAEAVQRELEEAAQAMAVAAAAEEAEMNNLIEKLVQDNTNARIAMEDDEAHQRTGVTGKQFASLDALQAGFTAQSTALTKKETQRRQEVAEERFRRSMAEVEAELQTAVQSLTDEEDEARYTIVEANLKGLTAARTLRLKREADAKAAKEQGELNARLAREEETARLADEVASVEHEKEAVRAEPVAAEATRREEEQRVAEEESRVQAEAGAEAAKVNQEEERLRVVEAAESTVSHTKAECEVVSTTEQVAEPTESQSTVQNEAIELEEVTPREETPSSLDIVQKEGVATCDVDRSNGDGD